MTEELMEEMARLMDVQDEALPRLCEETLLITAKVCIRRRQLGMARRYHAVVPMLQRIQATMSGGILRSRQVIAAVFEVAP